MRRRHIIVIFVILLAFCFGMLLGHLNRKSMTEDRKFEQYTDELFKTQIMTNTINLHYTLADPSQYGIRRYPITLGHMDAVSLAGDTELLQEQSDRLNQFDYGSLSKENQMTYDILKLSLETDRLLGSNYLMQEPLSPTLGIQAQLPILLAEYAFRNKDDIEDYLELLTLTEPYFQEIIEYEKVKSRSGLFMSSKTAGRIVEQCRSFIQNADTNYLLSTFEDRIRECSFLSEKQTEKYIRENEEAVRQHLIPAYENLIQALEQLKDTGKNPYGLCHYAGGQSYYEYLVKSSTGVYDDIPTIEQRLQQQLVSDFTRMRRLLKVHTEISDELEPNLFREKNLESPESILTDLQEKMAYDFPALKEIDYSVKYVHSDLEAYLSPAFYLTPPFDALSPNSIYLNSQSDFSDITRYTTLAHEGFPGHLYQTQYFAQSSPDSIRYLLTHGGYVEGWATYVESYAYQYAPLPRDIGEILWLNRSINLCLYSLTDLGIHYRGWTPDDTAHFLKIFGITDPDAVAEIYQCILEDPANYLQYYVGCLSFLDLRKALQERLGADFELLEFHRKLLEIGPAPFPILKKYLFDFYDKIPS